MHVLRQPSRTFPHRLAADASLRLRVDGLLTGEFGRYLDQRLVDQHRHRVLITGMGFQPQPLRFQRDGTAATKGIQHGRRIA